MNYKYQSYTKKLRSYNLQPAGGFTLIELIVTVGVFVIIMGLSGVAYLNIQRSSDLSNQLAQLVSSIRQTQTMAIGDQTLDELTNSRVGIHFEETSYTIFIGDIYNPSDTNNIVSRLPSEITISINLPSTDLLFNAKTGEVNNFDLSKNSVKLIHQNGDNKTIDINKLGVVNIE